MKKFIPIFLKDNLSIFLIALAVTITPAIYAWVHERNGEDEFAIRLWVYFLLVCFSIAFTIMFVRDWGNFKRGVYKNRE